jgi:hypothetical protein
MKLLAVEDYINSWGNRIITKGRYYTYTDRLNSEYTEGVYSINEDDFGHHGWFRCGIFIDVKDLRNKVLKEILE